jgi:hypothetical protein
LDSFANKCRSALFEIKPTTVQYIKLVARPVTTIPAGFAGAGNPSWLFMDELIIK